MPIVTIQEGQLKGTLGKNLDGNNFLQFLGIPYAEPPLGILRFQPPKPAKSWEGIKEASKPGDSAICNDDITFRLAGSENCLFLNVYTTEVLSKDNGNLKPVMFYIHGGGFVFGSSHPRSLGPEHLMTKDIVLVTINYRLGALGFLNCEGTDVCGNMGLKDQNLALKWVQRNIKEFGGDPNNITIFGNSAGGASVHAHILSSASKGLFHKAILQSGCMLNPWAMGQKNQAKQIVSHLGKVVKTELEALEILKTCPAMDIFEVQQKIPDIIYPYYQRPFGVIVEPPNESAFLSKHPRDILKEGSYNDVPIMIGYTDMEGIVVDLAKNFFEPSQQEFNMEDLIPYYLKAPKGSVKGKEIADKLKMLYPKQSTETVYNGFTDGSFLAGINDTIKWHSKTGKQSIYLYRMTISTQMNHFRALTKREYKGACHADEKGYLFHTEVNPEVKPESIEDKYIRIFIDLWTNFATYNNPTPDKKFDVKWEAVDDIDNLKVFNIGNKLEMINAPEQQRISFWSQIHKDYFPTE